MYALDLNMAHWRKSSRSSSNANCVEIAFLPGGWRKTFGGAAVGVRDSKNSEGPVLAFPADHWTAFLRTA